MRQPIPTRRFFHKRRKSNSSSHSGSDTSSEMAAALSVDSRGNYIFKSRSNSDATITPITSRTSLQSVATQSHTRDPSVSPMINQRSSTSSKATTVATSITSEPQSTNHEADRRASDIYSLSCVFLDIITFVLKRKSHEFSKHRSTKYKNSSGKGSHIDTSFHSNSQKVHTWMEILENEVFITPNQDQALFALPPLFQLIAEMQSPDPQLRPNAADMQERVYDALYNHGGLQDLHCTGVADLRPASTTLSFAGTSTSGSSSEPRLAAFPEITSLIPPALPPKSPRRPMTSGSSAMSQSSSSRPATPRRADTDASAVPPVPPMPLRLRNASMMDLGQWGRHRREESNEGRRVVGVSV